MSRPTPPPRPRIGGRIIRLATTPSTSDVAKQLLRSGEPHGTVVVAAEQTRGRGQRARRWASPPGGLWASLLARPTEVPATRAGLVSLAVAVAAARATTAVSGVPIMLKWPNDLLASRRKVGGVLVETAVARGRVTWAVIGIGINANVSLDDLPCRLRLTAASLREEVGKPVSLSALLREICARVDQNLRSLEAGEGGNIVSAWRALDTTVGRSVRASRGQRWRGTAAGVDSLGRLLVRMAGGRIVKLTTSSGVLIE